MATAGLFTLSMRAALPSVSLAAYMFADRILPRLHPWALPQRKSSPFVIATLLFVAICLAATRLASFLEATISSTSLFHLACVAWPLLCTMVHCGYDEVIQSFYIFIRLLRILALALLYTLLVCFSVFYVCFSVFFAVVMVTLLGSYLFSLIDNLSPSSPQGRSLQLEYRD